MILTQNTILNCYKYASQRDEIKDTDAFYVIELPNFKRTRYSFFRINHNLFVVFKLLFLSNYIYVCIQNMGKYLPIPNI